jgi:hypothetical protein
MITSRLINLPGAAAFRVGTINVDVVAGALVVVSIQIVFEPNATTAAAYYIAAVASHVRLRAFNLTDARAIFGVVRILDETAAEFQSPLIAQPPSASIVVASVTVTPAAVSFLSTGDAAAANAFVTSFVAHAAALANVSMDAVSIAFRINDGPPIPASTFMGGGAGRRRLQQLNSVVVVTTILVTSLTANATAVQATFDSLASNATAISAALGVQVLSLATVVQTNVLYPPPPPPLPLQPQPSPPPPSPMFQRPESTQDQRAGVDTGLDVIVYVLLAVGGVGVGVVGAFGYVHFKRRLLGMLEPTPPQGIPRVSPEYPPSIPRDHIQPQGIPAQPRPRSSIKGHVGLRRAWEDDRTSSALSSASTFSLASPLPHTAATRRTKVVPIGAIGALQRRVTIGTEEPEGEEDLPRVKASADLAELHRAKAAAALLRTAGLHKNR